MLFGSILGVRS